MYCTNCGKLIDDIRRITYNRVKKGFDLTGSEGSLMDNSEILAVSKILLESGVFTKKEISAILDKMITGCVPQKNMKLVKDLIANEKYHYVELHRKSHIKDKLWELGSDIKECNLLEIVYQKQTGGGAGVKRVIQPVAILFSEYYFYLLAYIVEQKAAGNYVQKYSYPAVFRIDRIKKYKEIGEKFKIPYASRFEEGEFRKKIQFMYTGESIIEAEVYGKGALMWLLSQGKRVKVLKPDSFREEMKKTLIEMLAQY